MIFVFINYQLGKNALINIFDFPSQIKYSIKYWLTIQFLIINQHQHQQLNHSQINQSIILCHNMNKFQTLPNIIYQVYLLSLSLLEKSQRSTMEQVKHTAKFNSKINNSIYKDLATQKTEHYISSAFNYNDNTNLDASTFEPPRDQTIIVDGINQFKSSDSNLYDCPICTRLRAICPYKEYKTYEYCKKCHPTSAYNTKDIKQSFGYSNHQVNRQQVNKVRFVQSNNTYPLKISEEKYRHQSPATKPMTNHYVTERVRSTTVCQPIQEIIFYPVIHNRFVYSQQRVKNNPQGKQANSSYGGKRNRLSSSYIKKSANNQKDISDFLASTNPNEILTPNEVKKLADSFFRT